MKNQLRCAAVIVASVAIVACGSADKIEAGDAVKITAQPVEMSAVETTEAKAPETTTRATTTTEDPGPRNLDDCATDGENTTTDSGVTLICGYNDAFGKLIWEIKPLTPRTTTTVVAKEGTRENPFLGVGLTLGDWDALSIGPVELMDFAVIEDASPNADPPPEGQVYARTAVSATYNGDSTGTGYDLAFSFGLAGVKAKVYDAAFLYDSDGQLAVVTDQPDVIVGGSILGYIYYTVDADDVDLLTVYDGRDGLQFVRGV